MTIIILPVFAALAASTTPATGTTPDPYWCPEPAPSVAVSIPSMETFQDQEKPRFSYEYIEGDVLVGSSAGFDIAGSYGLGESQFGKGLFGTGRLQYLTDEERGVDLDLFNFSLGATYVMPIEDGFDFLATGELEYGRVTASVGPASASASEFGLLFRGGARYAFDSQLEAFGGLSLRTIFNSDFALDGGVRYQYTDGLAFQASLDLGDETLLSFGVRYSL